MTSAPALAKRAFVKVMLALARAAPLGHIGARMWAPGRRFKPTSAFKKWGLSILSWFRPGLTQTGAKPSLRFGRASSFRGRAEERARSPTNTT